MITALLLSALLSQGYSSGGPGLEGGKVLASFPLQTTGPLITEDANTVAHVYWNGTALVDTKGNAWEMQGTVPQVTANPFTTPRYGAGPFSSSNYYSLASTNPLQFAGDFTVCVVWVAAAVGNQRLVSNSDMSTKGWLLIQANGGSVTMYTGTGSALTATANAAGYITGGPSVACAGREGGKSYVKGNLAATTSATLAYSPASTTPAYIGEIPTATLPLTGTIYEVYATSTPFSEATVVAIQQKVLGHYDGTAPLAVTRATNATYIDPTGTLWTVPSGVARITADGLLVEPARTQFVLNASTHPKTGEATGSITAQACVGWHDGTGTMTIAAGTATVTGLSCTTVAAGTLCPFTVTVAGTMAITTTAGTTRAQIECPGAYRTSFISSAGTAVARNADAVSATVPAVPSKGWCISGNWKPTSGTWPNALSLWTLGDTYNAANRASSWGNSSIYIVDAASGVKDLGDYTDPVAPWKIVTCDVAGALSLAVNGVLVDVSATGAGTGILTTPATTLHFGAQASAGTISDWYIKNVKLWSARSTKEASK